MLVILQAVSRTSTSITNGNRATRSTSNTTKNRISDPILSSVTSRSSGPVAIRNTSARTRRTSTNTTGYATGLLLILCIILGISDA